MELLPANYYINNNGINYADRLYVAGSQRSWNSLI